MMGHFNLGHLYLKIGQKDKAVEEYQILLKLDIKKAEELLQMIYGISSC